MVKIKDFHRCDIALFLQNEKKWKQLAELAIKNCEFQLAQECLHRAEDFGGLLLLASSAGHADMIAKLAESALEKGKNNVAFLAYYLLGRYALPYAIPKAAMANKTCHLRG